MKPRKAKVLTIIIEIAAIIVLGTAALLRVNSIWPWIVAMVLIIAASAVLLVFWRCPWCHRILPMQGMIGIGHCPYCGTDIDDAD